jgi:bifunctional non-homologous end joining protein LigD
MPAKVGFIEPMLLLRSDTLPDDAERWAYQLKLDGYRAIAFKRSGKLHRARTRNGFTPATRATLFKTFRALETNECPFVNLPEARSGRWGQGLTKAKMAGCQWLKPVLVAQIEFLEWTADNHLRHSRFVGLREDKRAKDVVRE